MSRDYDGLKGHEQGQGPAWEQDTTHGNAADAGYASYQMTPEQREQLTKRVIKQIRGEFLGGPRNYSSGMMATRDGAPSWKDVKDGKAPAQHMSTFDVAKNYRRMIEANQPVTHGPQLATAGDAHSTQTQNRELYAQLLPKTQELLAASTSASRVAATVRVDLYERLIAVARQEVKEHALNWGQPGSVAELDLPSPYAGTSYEGNFKCNIFINTALQRAGLMRPGMRGETTPKEVHVAPPNVNGLINDVEAVAEGDAVNPKHGEQWFDIVPAAEARPGDLIAIRGRFRKDPAHGVSEDERNGHIELITDLTRHSDGRMRKIVVAGAGTKAAAEHRIGGLTFGNPDLKADVFTPDTNTWFLRARPLRVQP